MSKTVRLLLMIVAAFCLMVAVLVAEAHSQVPSPQDVPAVPAMGH